jgi:hypothetical protein
LLIGILISTAVSLTACASNEAIKKSDEYGVTSELIETQYGAFKVYEHPSGKRLAVSTTLGGSLAAGAAKGITLGAGNILPSEGGYQEAAEAYLKKHQKVFQGCKIKNGYLLQEPVFEFVLDC